MDSNQASMLTSLFGGYFPSKSLPKVNLMLNNMDQNTAAILLSDLKHPTIALLLGLCLGIFGVDRFYIGDTFWGFLKLITLGGCGIWACIDWFVIKHSTRKNNLSKIAKMNY